MTERFASPCLRGPPWFSPRPHTIRRYLIPDLTGGPLEGRVEVHGGAVGARHGPAQGPDRWCLPRHPPHCRPSFRE
jgi:hypothetical protein